MCTCIYYVRKTDLRHIDAALLERTVVGIMGAHVSIFAPVAGKGAIHTRQTPTERDGQKICFYIIQYYASLYLLLILKVKMQTNIRCVSDKYQGR